MIAVVKPGLETSVQDFPGRLGYWEQGFPPSGPMDPWSFRLANLLVGNEPGAAGLECQFLGPTLRFEADTVFAVTGADMGPTIDGEPVTLWQSHRAKPRQVLALGAAVRGARAYLAFAGAIDCPAVLGSRSTFHQAGIRWPALRAWPSMPPIPAWWKVEREPSTAGQSIAPAKAR